MTVNSGGAGLFLGRSLRQFRQVCSIMPSSPGVGQAMARAITGRPVQGVVELGAGTGPVTRQLLAHGVAACDLVAVELDSVLAAHLGTAFPDIEVLNVPAQDLATIWQRDARRKVGGVVSTMPLKVFDQETIDAVLHATFDILAPGGCFVQFTYRFVSPVAAETLERFGLAARRSEIVWNNLPPAAIWVYTRAL